MKQTLIDALNESRIDKDNPPDSYLRALIYSDFGLGKSTWAASSEQRTLFIDTSSGFVVLKDYDNVDVLTYKGLTQLAAVGTAITEGIEGWNYDLVVIDEISSVYQIDLELVTSARAGGSNLRDEVIPEQRDYMATQNRLMKNLRPLLDAPVHLVMLCHERRTTDKATGVSTIESDLAPRLSKEVNRSLHLLGRLSISKQGERELVVNPARNVQAKNRLGLSNNPTLTDVLEKF